jgi:hypothetical protein
MKSSSNLIFLSLLASQALACVHFQGGIQVGGINHGIWINIFEDNGKQPCRESATKNGDGWFSIGCEPGTELLVSLDGRHVRYSYGAAYFAFDQKVTSSKAESFGACDDRRGACVRLGTEYDWDTWIYC